MTTDINSEHSGRSHALAKGQKLALVLGVLMIGAGMGAILFPLYSTLAVALCVGFSFFIAGVAQAIWAFGHRHWSSIGGNLFIALLWLVLGALLLLRPLEGVFALTIVAAAAFLFEGIVKAMFAFSIRPLPGWKWILFNAVASIFLGGLLGWMLPESALWALGTIAGINIVIGGMTLLMLRGIVEKITHTA